MFKFIWRIVILISTSYGIYGGVYMAADQPNSGFLLYYTTPHKVTFGAASSFYI